MNAQLAQVQALLTKDRPNPDKAIETLKQLKKRANDHWLLHHYMGVALIQKQQYADAALALNAALKKGGDEAETFHLLGIANYHLHHFEEAIYFEKEAIQRKPDLVQAWINLGESYRSNADLDNAIIAFNKANQLDPKNAGIAYRIGTIYFDQGDLEQARTLYEIAIQVNPKYKEGYLGLSVVHQELQKFDVAKQYLEKGLEVFPRDRVLRIQMAVLYKVMGEYSAAIDLNRELLTEKPNDGSLRVNYALCLLETGQFNQAEENYLRALKDAPEVGESLSNYLMGIHYNPERTKQEIFDAHLLWDQRYAPKTRQKRPVPTNTDPDKKLRVGFISGGFRKHPVGWMITTALEHLPKDQFEIYCYSTQSTYDGLTHRIRKSCDKWVSVIGYRDEVVADIIKKDEVDILVELSGHSAFNRLKTIALEPAPITIKWVGGLFNTTGMQSMDYLLTDQYESPDGEEEFYTEKLVRMPDDYIAYVPPEYEIKVAELPAKYNGYITFGCFNNPSKLNNDLLKVWADIMKSVPGSKLFLKSKQYDTQAFKDEIISQMKKNGIEEDRLILEGYALHEDLLCSYNKVDIALDPWPYSGGLTTVEALWMGVPVISNQGPTFAGKHSATHLSNAGHPEWVTDNWDDYKRLVIDLVSDLPVLESIRMNLRDELLASPVCDGPRFGANLATAFRAMWHQRVEGYKHELPEGEWQQHIDVAPISNEALDAFIQKNGFNPEEPYTTSHKVLELHDDLKISVPLYKDNFTRYVLEEQKQWVDAEAAFLTRIVPENSTIIDVGAGFGVYALPLAKKVGENGCVFAFEANPETATHLQESKRLNQLPQLEVIAKAVSNQSGKVEFRQKGKVEDSVLSTDQFTTMVECTTIDDFWSEYGQPPVHVLKVDVNGKENDVLEGAEALLEEMQPMLVLNISDETDIAGIQQSLKLKGFELYELIPELGIISTFNNDENPYRKNLIALTSYHLKDVREQGVLFEDSETNPTIKQGAGLEYLKGLPWANQVSFGWQQSADNDVIAMYFNALDAIGTAIELDESDRVEKAHLLLLAATNLMSLYNANSQNVPISLTLARVLLVLGKRADAVDITKKLTHRLLTGQAIGDLSLPFFPPLEIQDIGKMHTNLETWIKIKVVEAWLLLKDLSTYSFSDKDIKYMSGLAGNPEVVPHINHLVKNVLGSDAVVVTPDPERVEEGKFIHIVQNHEQATVLANLLNEVNNTTGQCHLLYVEANGEVELAGSEMANSDHVTLFNSENDMESVAMQCISLDVDAVYMHGLNNDWQRKLIKSVAFKKHIGWVIWGEDLYQPITNKKPIRYLANFLDSILVQNQDEEAAYKDEYGNIASYTFSYTNAHLLAEASTHIVAWVRNLETVIA